MDSVSVTEHGELFLRFRDGGDLAAFEQLMAAYHQPVFNYLMRMLRKKEDAEDALQEVWLRIIRQKHTYREQGNFSSWLYRIAHNYCLDLYRKRNSQTDTDEIRETEDGFSLLDIVASDTPTPFDEALDKETMIKLEEAVNELPEAIREVFILRIIHGVPFKEIAEIQQSPIGTVLSRMHQAVKRLKESVLNDLNIQAEESA